MRYDRDVRAVVKTRIPRSGAEYGTYSREPQQGKYDEASHLYVRAIEEGERMLGPDHPDVILVVSNWARLLQKQVGGAYCHLAVAVVLTLAID